MTMDRGYVIHQVDRDAADEIIEVRFDNSHSIYAYEIATILAAHREKAVAELVEAGGMVMLMLGNMTAPQPIIDALSNLQSAIAKAAKP